MAARHPEEHGPSVKARLGLPGRVETARPQTYLLFRRWLGAGTEGRAPLRLYQSFDFGVSLCPFQIARPEALPNFTSFFGGGETFLQHHQPAVFSPLWLVFFFF